MKNIFRILIFTVLFFVFFIIFIPKEKIFNYGLDKLSRYDILFKRYDFNDKYFTFNIQNSNIYYKNIEALKISKIDFKTLIFYNNLNINNVKVDDSLKQFIPSSIKNINIKYTILNPLFIDINIYSKEFKVLGYYDIINQKIILNIKVSQMFKKYYPKLLSQMKYNKNTKDYTYAYKL